MSECAVYRMYDAADHLLYVGMSINVPQRLASHRSNKEWWPAVARIEVKHFAGRRVAAEEERFAIDTESPLHNVKPGTCVSTDTLEERRDRRRARGMYRVRDLRCGYCQWTGGWAPKGLLLSEVKCPSCGHAALTGTPVPTEAAA